MNKSTFESEMRRAQTMATLERPDYWAGYQRGLRRKYHGESFGTDQEHELWLSLGDDLDKTRAERGRGYRDAFSPSTVRYHDPDMPQELHRKIKAAAAASGKPLKIWVREAIREKLSR